jgi:hypothetical protein
MSVSEPRPTLDQIQRWMQAVMMHPAGVEAGVGSDAAREQIDVDAENVGRVVLPSRHQTSLDRLRIYGNAYYARLLECLNEEFPALRHAVGEEAFASFAAAYLQAHPSQSYTLGELGRAFPRFLCETRPPEERSESRPNWTDLVIDLATVERTYSEVFDGPGVENARVLQPGDLNSVPPDRWPEARLVPAPCLRLLELAYPVHEYISAVRRKEPPAVPAPRRTFLVVTRRDYRVRRCAMSQDEFRLLAALVAGEKVGAAISRLVPKLGRCGVLYGNCAAF